MQIPELLAQRKIVSAACHARYSARGTKGKWRYASSKAGTKRKWRYASSKAIKEPKGNGDIQAAKRD